MSSYLDEAEAAIVKVIAARGIGDAASRARRARSNMERAFPDAAVTGYEVLIDGLNGLPDPKDAHVIAAAVRTRASVIVTDNLRDFPERLLAPLNLKAQTVDALIADTISLDAGRAIATVERMRERLRKPEKSPEVLLRDMKAVGLTEAVDILCEHLSTL